MKTNTEKIRIGVFKIWFLTLAIIVVIFGAKFTRIGGIGLPFSSVFQSLQMMMGLVILQIGVMTAFYLNIDKQKNKIETLSNDQVMVITWLSLFYHLIFIATVVYGVGFYGFDQHADGNALQRNTAAVVAIVGLFSTFLAPVAFLFASPRETEEGRRGRSQNRKQAAASDRVRLPKEK